MKRMWLTILLLSTPAITTAQKLTDVRQAITDLLEPLAEKQLVQEDYSELLDDLVYLYENPLNLNSATKEELEQIPFLSDYQIENILFYVYNNGPLLTIYELNAVEGLPIETIRQIIPFLTVAPIVDSEKRKPKLNGEFIIRGRTTVQTPKGYLAPNDSTPPVYSGSRERVYTRIQLNYGNRLFAGFTLERDPGEPMFNRQIAVMDFMSGYIMLKPTGVIKKIIIGDYKASFGQGVGVWTGLAFSKNSNVIDIRRRAKQLDKYSSANENSYLRGVAAELEINKFQLHLFGSYKKSDGTLFGFSGISSIRQDGYHRTVTELSYRKNITETTFGGVASWQSGSIKIEAGQTYWRIDRPLIQEGSLYKILSFSGDSLFTTFTNYSWFGHKVILFGEIALQNFNNFALYQGLTYSPGADVKLALNYRNYSKSHLSVVSNPFAESSTINGESGLYMALSCSPFPKLTVDSYFDIFWYRWLKFRTDAPTTGNDYLLQTDYSFTHNLSLLMRYKFSNKERNRLFYVGNKFPLTSQKTNSIRLQLNYSFEQSWRLQSRIEQLFFDEARGHKSKGFLIYLDIKHSFCKDKLATNVRFTHFDTNDFYSRIYAWETDVLHAFSIPFYSGSGVRFLFNLSFKPTSRLQFWFRLANTYMPDVSSIGSGYNMVEGNNHIEVKLQVKCRF